MIVSRRRAIQSGVAAVAVAASGTKAMTSPRHALIVFDSRIPASLAYAKSKRGPRIDVAREDENLWRTLRSEAPDGTIVGMTGWSDWVIVRGLLEEKGKRLKSEEPLGSLFRWTMS